MLGVLIDIDGVIYEGGRLVAGAGECVAYLQQQAIPFLFVTNTSSRPASAVIEKLKAMGISMSADKLLTPAIAAQSWILANYCEPAALFIPDTTKRDFSRINVLDQSLNQGAKSVVIGDLGEKWDYARLNQAFRLLINTGNHSTKLIALGMTKYFRSDTGLRLDVGPFVKALEFASGNSPIIMGKPATSFFQQAANQLELPLNQLVMIGDDIVSDVHGAQRCGMTGILVKTGKFRESDLHHEIKPAAVINSIAELPAWLELHRANSTLSA